MKYQAPFILENHPDITILQDAACYYLMRMLYSILSALLEKGLLTVKSRLFTRRVYCGEKQSMIK